MTAPFGEPLAAPLACLGGLETLPCAEPARYEARALADIEDAGDPMWVVYWPICDAHAAYWRQSGDWQIKTLTAALARECVRS